MPQDNDLVQSTGQGIDQHHALPFKPCLSFNLVSLIQYAPGSPGSTQATDYWRPGIWNQDSGGYGWSPFWEYPGSGNCSQQNVYTKYNNVYTTAHHCHIYLYGGILDLLPETSFIVSILMRSLKLLMPKLFLGLMWLAKTREDPLKPS